MSNKTLESPLMERSVNLLSKEENLFSTFPNGTFHSGSSSLFSRSASSRAAVSTQTSVLAVFQGGSILSINPNPPGTTPSSTSFLQQMHNGGRWTFFSNNTFKFTPVGIGTVVRSDLYPLNGTFTSNSNGVFFNGSRSSTIGSTGSASVAISGTLGVVNGGIVARIIQQSRVTNVANINGIPFSQTVSRYNDFNLKMTRIA